MRAIFVGMHNKPHMKALDSKTTTGKIIDTIIENLPIPCIKTNLCDIDYLPKDKKLIETYNKEWSKTYQIDTITTIVVLLGKWVQKNFSVKTENLIKLPHPASIFGIKNKEMYVLDAIEKINKITIKLP